MKHLRCSRLLPQILPDSFAVQSPGTALSHQSTLLPPCRSGVSLVKVLASNVPASSSLQVVTAFWATLQ
jgi:hypothetical protein